MRRYLGDRVVCGRSLRWVALAVLSDTGRAMSLGALAAAIEGTGLVIGGRASKELSDALRREVASGRVIRVRRGVYRAKHMPRSTQWGIRQRVLAIHQGRSAGVASP